MNLISFLQHHSTFTFSSHQPPFILVLSAKMFARLARTARPSALTNQLGAVRNNSTLPIPPKIATPKSAQGPGGSSARMESVVGFYKSLPKGDAPQKRGGGIKARYFDGKNASGKPIVATLFTLFLIGYSIDYATHLRKYTDLAIPTQRKEGEQGDKAESQSCSSVWSPSNNHTLAQKSCTNSNCTSSPSTSSQSPTHLSLFQPFNLLCLAFGHKSPAQCTTYTNHLSPSLFFSFRTPTTRRAKQVTTRTTTTKCISIKPIRNIPFASAHVGRHIDRSTGKP